MPTRGLARQSRAGTQHGKGWQSDVEHQADVENGRDARTVIRRQQPAGAVAGIRGRTNRYRTVFFSLHPSTHEDGRFHRPSRRRFDGGIFCRTYSFPS